MNDVFYSYAHVCLVTGKNVILSSMLVRVSVRVVGCSVSVLEPEGATPILTHRSAAPQCVAVRVCAAVAEGGDGALWFLLRERLKTAWVKPFVFGKVGLIEATLPIDKKI